MSDLNLKARISMQDDVTEPLMEIVDSLNIVISTMKESKAASQGMIDASSLNAAQKTLKSVGAEFKNATEEARKTNEKLKKQTNEVQVEAIKTKSNIQSLLNTFKSSNPLSLFKNMKTNLSEIKDLVSKNEAGLGGFLRILSQLPGPAGALLAKFQALLGTILILNTIKTFVGWLMKSSDETANITARLALMNDGLRNNVELQDYIHKKAQESRIEFNELADSIAKFGNNAKAAFSSTEEVVEFASLLSKTYKTAGTNAQGVAAANLQISQALSMGVLRGQELNAVFENASPVVDLLAKEMGVSRGELKKLGEEGQITANVLKNALLNNAKEINKQFRAMPLTLQDLQTVIKNDSEHAFKPVQAKITQILNSPAIKAAIENIVSLIYMIANATLIVATIVGAVIDWIHMNWEIVRAILIAVGIVLSTVLIPILLALAKVAIGVLISILTFLAPLLIKIALVALVVYLISQAFEYLGITAGDVIGFIIGSMGVLGAIIYNVIAFVWNIIISFFQYITNRFVNFVNMKKQGWYDLKVTIKDFALFGAKALSKFLRGGAEGFAAFVNSAIDSINALITKLNSLKFSLPSWLPRIGGKTFSLNVPQISRRVSVGRNIGDKMADFVNGIEIQKPEFMKAPQFEEKLKADYYSLKGAFKEGMDMGRNISKSVRDKINNIKGSALEFFESIPKGGDGQFGSDNPNNIPDIPGSGKGGSGVPKGAKDALKAAKGTEKNTKDMAKALDRTNDNLEYLKDKAVRRNISSLKLDINMNINNKFGDIYQENDLDGFISKLEDKIGTAVERGRRRVEF